MSVSTAAHPVIKAPLRGTKARRGILSTGIGRVLVLVMVAALAGGVIFALRSTSQPAPAAYRTQAVARGTVAQTVTVSGTVSPAGQVQLSFRTSGRLAEVLVAAGQTVTAGQPLAKLDTTDLAAALTSAEQNLANAQASYQKQLLSAADTRAALAEAQTSTASDIAAAQSSLAKLLSTYVTAKANFQTYTSAAFTDTTGFQTDIETVRAALESVLNELLASAQPEVKSAQTSLYLTFTPIANIAAMNTSQLQPALAEYERARSDLLTVVASFDAAWASGSDATAIASAYQTAQAAYSVASSRLGAALDLTSSAFSGIQGNIVAAQGQLTTSTTKYIGPPYDGWRSDLTNVYGLIGDETARVSSAKVQLSQASTALSTIGDALQGGLAAASASVATTQDRAAQSLRAAQSAVANIPLNLQSAQGSVESAQSAVDAAHTNLDAAVLTAPSAGVVTTINGIVGQSVSAGGTTAFAVLASANAVTLHGTVGESNVTKLKLGQDANVTIDAIGAGTKMTGKVTAIDFVATITSGVPVYGIDVTVTSPPAAVRSGMTGTAQVIQSSKSNVLTVPNLAIRTKAGTRYVQVMKDGVPVDTEVTFGITNGTITEVTSGLAEGDLVVLPQPTAGATSTPGGGINIPGIR